MTVREFLDTHPDADLDLSTPEGRIYLDAAGRRRLESGRPLIADNGSPKTAVYVQPDDLLEQITLLIEALVEQQERIRSRR